MNRRGFLKNLMVGGAAAAIPISVSALGVPEDERSDEFVKIHASFQDLILETFRNHKHQFIENIEQNNALLKKLRRKE